MKIYFILFTVFYSIFYLALSSAKANEFESEFEFEQVHIKNSSPLILASALGLGASYYYLNVEALDSTTINKLVNQNLNNQLKLNYFDKWALNKNSKSAGLASDLLLVYHSLLPAILLNSIDGTSNKLSYTYMYVEAQTVNLSINGLAKTVFKRNRPYVYNSNVPIGKKLRADAHFSFYSGHSSIAFTSAVFTSKMFSELEIAPQYNKYVWAVNLLSASVTGYLRVEAGNHFPSDVLVGAVMGSLIGYYLPELHRENKDDFGSETEGANPIQILKYSLSF